jgi:iron complex outermembrane receptor protein
LSLSGNYSYANAEYKDFETINGAIFGSTEVVNLSGNKLNRAPENKFTLAADYLVPMGDMGDLTLSATFSWVDDSFSNVFNDEAARVDSWSRTDLRATWGINDNTQVVAYVKNLEDKRHSVDAALGTSSAGFVRTDTLTDPRVIGLRVNYSF